MLLIALPPFICGLCKQIWDLDLSALHILVLLAVPGIIVAVMLLWAVTAESLSQLLFDLFENLYGTDD